MLFIIPGILLLFLLYFSQFAYIHEGDRGLDALLRSRALVVGRLGAVAKRLLVLFFYVISISFLVSLPYAVFFGFVGNEVLWIEVVFELVVQLVTAVLTLASIAVGNQLFLELRSDRPRTAPAASVLLRYRLLAIFGSLAAIIMLAVMIIFGFFAWLGYGFIDELPIEDQTEAVRDEVIFTELIAEEYRVQNGTFEGVCERLLPAVVLADTVECNDSETAWALAAQSTDDVWCTDAAGYGKVIAGSIGERTACLNLPEPLSNEEASVGTTTTPVEDMSEIIPVL